MLSPKAMALDFSLVYDFQFGLEFFHIIYFIYPICIFFKYISNELLIITDMDQNSMNSNNAFQIVSSCIYQ